MAPEEIQALVDAGESDAARRYERRRELVALVSDAVRRADAMTRLETALRLSTR